GHRGTSPNGHPLPAVAPGRLRGIFENTGCQQKSFQPGLFAWLCPALPQISPVVSKGRIRSPAPLCSFSERGPPRGAGPPRRKLQLPACPAAGRLQLPACLAARPAWCWREAAALAEPPPGSPPGEGRSGNRPPPRPLLRRTPGGARRSGNAGFKSPIPSPRSCQPDGASEEALQYEIEELKRKDLALDQEIAQFLSEGYSLEELEKHISLLHEYNDIKDAGQMLLGKLAVIRGVTTKQLYPEYDLELSD
ncbi:DNA repair protein SWI5 homolog, partial [Dromaius novaehollandiae]